MKPITRGAYSSTATWPIMSQNVFTPTPQVPADEPIVEDEETAVARLASASATERLSALEALRDIESHRKVTHAATAVRMVGDVDHEVAWAALLFLQSLDASSLAQHTAALIEQLEALDASMRWRGVEVLG